MMTCLPGAKVLLISCLPRYTHTPCCAEENYLIDTDKSKLAAILTVLKRTIRSYTVSLGKNSKTSE